MKKPVAKAAAKPAAKKPVAKAAAKPAAKKPVARAAAKPAAKKPVAKAAAKPAAKKPVAKAAAKPAAKKPVAKAAAKPAAPKAAPAKKKSQHQQVCRLNSRYHQWQRRTFSLRFSHPSRSLRLFGRFLFIGDLSSSDAHCC